MNKELLRQKYLNIRDNISQAEEKSIDISNKLLELPCYKKASKIGIYVSFGKEVATYYLIDKILNDHKKLYAPKIIEHKMIFCEFNNFADLVSTGSWGIKEPVSSEDSDDIELMIIPGIVFDEEFNRVGYGKAYYDRYLELHKNNIKLALAYDIQIIKENIESYPHDIKMDCIISEKRLLWRKY